MTDLSALSDSQLQALHEHATAPDVSKMSDDELMAAYHKPGIIEDAVKGAGSGLANATVGTFGGLGDIRSGASSATDWAANKLGVAPDKVQAFKDLAAKAASVIPGAGLIANAPTSDQIKKAFPDPLVPYDYKPEYATGEIAKKVGEFAPNMLLGGPEGAAARFLTNVAAPAVGSEIGGRVAGPVGELAGALVGSGGATSAVRKFQEMATARQAAKAIPTGEELLKSGSSGFEAVKASDAIIKPPVIEQMAKDIKTEMLNEGKHPSSEGQQGVFAALDRLEALGKAPGGVTSKDMEVIRKSLVDLKPNQDAGPTARMAADKFMEKYSNLGQQDLLHGSNPFPVLKDAIGDWAAGKRSNAITGKMDLAELNAGTAGSGANQDNAMRQAIKQLARPMNNTNVPVAKKLGFNDQEIEAVKQAATGTPVGNTARYLGKYAPTGIVSAAGGVGLGHLAGGPIGAALPAAGYIAKKIGDLSTKRAVSAIDSLVRSRSPLAAHVASQLPPQIIQQMPAKSQRLLQSLVLADPSLANLAQPNQATSQGVSQTNAN